MSKIKAEEGVPLAFAALLVVAIHTWWALAAFVVFAGLLRLRGMAVEATKCPARHRAEGGNHRVR